MAALPNQQLKLSIVNALGAEAYPIAGFTYLLVYSDLVYLNDAAREQALVEFLRWCLTKGQASAAELHFTPLPEGLRQWALHQIEPIKTSVPAPDPSLR
jgi:phosphate transport system substrate-binding protein